jgi:hypothetical protein
MRSKDVDQKKYPHLHAAIRRAEVRYVDEGWARVVEMRRKGQDPGRLVRRLLGVKGEPMSEETKEKLRQYNEEHAEEIKARKEQEKEVRARTIALLTTGKKGRSKA